MIYKYLSERKYSIGYVKPQWGEPHKSLNTMHIYMIENLLTHLPNLYFSENNC